jgi:hypothetical protein
MWNWMQGAIFGIEVSGLTEIVHSPLLKESDHGPAWLTGENLRHRGQSCMHDRVDRFDDRYLLLCRF